MCFLYVKGVLKHIQKYNYDVSGKISVPQIDDRPITLLSAVAEVSGKIAKLQKSIYVKEINKNIEEILNEEKYYFYMENNFPEDIVRKLIKC